MIKNPWLNISWSDTVADVDKAYIAQHYGSLNAFDDAIGTGEWHLKSDGR